MIDLSGQVSQLIIISSGLVTVANALVHLLIKHFVDAKPLPPPIATLNEHQTEQMNEIHDLLQRHTGPVRSIDAIRDMMFKLSVHEENRDKTIDKLLDGLAVIQLNIKLQAEGIRENKDGVRDLQRDIKAFQNELINIQRFLKQ